MSTDIFTVDAFTAKPFSGNQAAVCLLSKLKEFPPDELLLQVSSEMNLSETAFILFPKQEGENYKLRWFTPTVEVPLCGHATLASAHILFEQRIPKGNKVVFETLSGNLGVSLEDNGSLAMDFPQGKPSKVSYKDEILELLSHHLGIPKKEDILDVHHCPKTRKLLVEVLSTEIVKNLNPNFGALQQISFPSETVVKGIIVTTKGGSSQFKEYDFLSRYFAPWVGINEDPVTGSAHTVLAVYWAQKLAKSQMTAFQASVRGGHLELLLVQNDRVIIGGNAVTIVSGKIQI